MGGRLPRPNNAEDALEVLNVAKTLISTGKVVIEDFVLDEAFVTR